MIRMKHVMAFARAEAHHTIRLARYWIFLGLSCLIALIWYFYYSFLHGLYSSYTASLGPVSPRFLLGSIGMYYLVIYVVGTVFLAFDIRARDMRERMCEVLDSRPYTNLELVVGRFLGLFTASWIPIIVLAVLMEVLGLLLVSLGAPIGEPLNILSVFGFVFLMVLPALAFSLSLVFLVTLLVRNRLVAAILVLAMLGGSLWATMNFPVIYGRLLDVIGMTSLRFPSEITPAMSNLDGWMQRFGFLFAAFGLLGFSAAVHPRLAGCSRGRLASGGAVLIIFAILFAGFGFYRSSEALDIAEKWKTAHAACTDIPVPDLLSISGTLQIDPGKALDMELDLTFRAPDQDILKKALFTLNPGQKVTAALDAAGKPMVITHENGLLELQLPDALAPGEETRVHLTIEGVPDNQFAFFETSVDPAEVKLFGAANLFLLGMEPAFFDSRFVALMPGVRWLPASGPETGRDDPRSRPVDFFTVNLTVDLPDGWLAAGPGRRQKTEGNGEGERFRFSPGAPVPEVALIASRFESRGVEIEGVYMELLVHPGHMKNVELLADTGEKIRSWIEEHFQEATDNGIGYPYDGLTLVEVPSTMRTYGGGWRMDTVMAPPGMLLMREIGFPNARFDTTFRDPDRFRDQEGGIVQAKWERLKLLFESDFSGGNIFTGAARNFLMDQTSPGGPDALALNFIMKDLSSRLVAETTGYFSAYLYADQKKFENAINSTVGRYLWERTSGTSIADAAIDSVTSGLEVWDRALEVSLKEMDPWKDPAIALDVLTLKGRGISRSILDTLGREKTARLLSSIRNAHQGGSYDLEDLQAAGKALGYDLDALLDDRLDSTALPGFVCSEVKGYRLPDSEDGSPRYQLLFVVRNDESASGVFRFFYEYAEEGQDRSRIKSPAIRLAGKSAVCFGTVVSRPPTSVSLEPYLSLNRTTVDIQLPSIDPEKIQKVDPIEGAEQIPWTLPKESLIVVDDLDAGFQVAEGEKKKGLRIGTRKNTDKETDQGLPSQAYAFRIPSSWSRISMPISWGKYRHTLVTVGAGDGDKKAIFTSMIHEACQWDLEIYIPTKEPLFPGRKWGNWHYTVSDGNGDEHKIEFDSDAAAEGWNLAGNFDLPEGEVSVTLSNETDGAFVLADAIRWVPSAGD